MEQGEEREEEEVIEIFLVSSVRSGSHLLLRHGV